MTCPFFATARPWRLHLRMTVGHHFPRKNVLLSTQDLSQKERFFAKIVHFPVTV